MEGIDIYSKFQTVNNWNQVRAADIGWCYQKVSDGIGIRNVQTPDLGHAAGVLQGGYHFSQPGDPIGQANLLVDRCQVLHMVDLRPALDLEDNPPGLGPNIPDSQKADWAVAFGRQVGLRGHGFTLYANDSTWSFIKGKVMSALPGTFRWIARYRVAPPDNPWDAWQYTSSGSVPGIAAGSVDRNKGAVPLNIGGNMPLVDPDFNYIFYNNPIQNFGNFSQLLNNIKVNAAAGAALGTAVNDLKNLIIADSANDVTAAQVSDAVMGRLVAEIGPIVEASIDAALVDVHVDVDVAAIKQDVLDGLHDRLLN